MTLDNFNLLVLVAPTFATAAGGGPPVGGSGAAPTDATGMVVDPGRSGTIPNLSNTTLLKISILDSSTGLSGRSAAGAPPTGGIVALRAATTLSQTGLAMNAISLNLDGLPKLSTNDA